MPAIAPRGAIASISANCSAVNGFAVSASSSCWIVRMPSVGTNCGCLPSTQPIASGLGVMPKRVARPWRPPTSLALASRFAPVSRGRWVRASLAPIGLAEQPAREHAVQRRADAELREHREDRVLRITARDRVLDLEIGDGMDLRRPPDRLGTDLGQPDRTYMAGLHQVRERADGVLDRYRRVQPRWAIHVDVIRAEPDQRVREEVLEGSGSRVHAPHVVVGAAQHAELDRELDLVAAAPICGSIRTST